MHKIWTLIVIILMGLIMANCTASKESTGFPTGLFGSDQVRNTTYRFNEDGTFILYWYGSEYIKGEYSVEGTNFYIEDIDIGSVCESPGKYEWSYGGEFLHFEAIEEDCSPRKNNLNERSWVLIENQ